MTKRCLPAVAAASCLFAITVVWPHLSARAADIYARADVGYSITARSGGDIYDGTGFGNSFGQSVVADAGIGMMIPLSGFDLRLEGMLGYRPDWNSQHSAQNPSGTVTESTETSIASLTAMGNLYVDVPTSSAFTPYVGGGVGVASNSLGALQYNFNGSITAAEGGTVTSHLAWAAMAGIGYAVSPHAMLDLGYRYLDAGTVRTSGNLFLLSNGLAFTQPPIASNLHAHEITVGFRFKI